MGVKFKPDCIVTVIDWDEHYLNKIEYRIKCKFIGINCYSEKPYCTVLTLERKKFLHDFEIPKGVFVNVDPADVQMILDEGETEDELRRN